MKISSRVFHRTSLNLAGLYLAIIMCISLVFSIAQYRLSTDEIDRAYRRQENFSMHQPQFADSPDGQQLIQQHERDLISVKHNLLIRLIGINIVILVGGGLLSYYLARRSLQPIEAAHEAQSRFTADASHELRTPLTVMQTEIEVALMNPKLNLDEAKKLLLSNLEELAKLTALSEGLLHLAQIDHNSVEYKKLDAKAVVEDAIARIKPMAAKKRIKFTKDLKSASIAGNHVSLTEAVVTLLENAVKYSPAGSTVQITSNIRSKHYELSVKDTGIGIKATEQAHIFDRFYRADHSRGKEAVNGYGLGLAIAKSIVDSHGGQLSVKSTPGKGSTFTVSLPIA